MQTTTKAASVQKVNMVGFVCQYEYKISIRFAIFIWSINHQQTKLLVCMKVELETNADPFHMICHVKQMSDIVCSIPDIQMIQSHCFC